MTAEVATTKEDRATSAQGGALLRRVNLVPVAIEGSDFLEDWDAGASSPRQSFFRRYWMSLILVGIPMILATIYFFFIASDIYVSETRYLVRSSSGSTDDGLGAFMQSQGLARAADETYAVNAYLVSRDAADTLARNNHLRDIMSRPEGDIFSRFPGPFSKPNDEQFYRSYQRFVDINVDSSTGITTLKVNGFRPDDARDLAQALLKIGEQFINTLNTRAHADALSFAENLQREAQDRLAKVETRLADYRNKELIVDPQKESSALIIQLGVMSTELSRLEAGLAQQVALTPDSPSIRAQRQRIQSMRDEMAKLQAKIVGGPNSIADKLRGFELLTLEQELAAKSLAAATIEMEKARRDALTQRIYIQQIITPNRPDQPLLPHRILGWLVVLMISLAVYWIVRSLTSTVLDHQA